MDPGLAMAVGAGANLGGSVLNYFGQQETNQMNNDQFNAAMAQNQANFVSAQAFADRMSSTQYTRGRRDMEAAGLNPVMMMHQGGDSAPTVTAANQGVGNSMQNPRLGDALSSAVSGAMNALSTIENVKNVQADTGLKALQAVTEKERAKQVEANAYAEKSRAIRSDIESDQISSQTKAVKAEADYREEAAIKNKANIAVDKLLEQVGQGSGALNNATSAITNFMYPWRLMKQDQYRHEDRMLKGYKAE